MYAVVRSSKIVSVFAVIALPIYVTVVISASPTDYPWGQRHHPIIKAFVNLTYKDPVHDHTLMEADEIGRYGTRSRLESERGWVVHVRTSDNKTHGCTALVNVPPYRWVALVERGVCEFSQKIHNALVHNASAVIVYNYVTEAELIAMDHHIEDAVAIFVSQADGRRLALLVDGGVAVYAQISVGRWILNSANGSSELESSTLVLYVTISVVGIVLLTLALVLFRCSGHIECLKDTAGEDLNLRGSTHELDEDDGQVVTSDCIPLVSGVCTSRESGATTGQDTRPSSSPPSCPSNSGRRNIRLTYNSMERVAVV